MNNIPIGVDETDHAAFFCPACDVHMIVTDVKTQNVVVNTGTGEHDNCTWIRLQCPKCSHCGQRKFYWHEISDTIRFRTDTAEGLESRNN
jgi:hypothetical protein